MERLDEGDPREIGGYRTLGRLGAGGMGRVYLARTPGHRRVALKVVHPHLAGDAGFRSRFAREVATARQVSGVFTAEVLDDDTGAETPWMATEYLPGPTLHRAVAEGGPLHGEQLRELAAALAEALDGIHGSGLVHRDLKPGNIVLVSDGPRVIDFGIAKALDAVEATHTARGFGTLAYASPEQALGGAAAEPGDVFALGSVLVFAATGTPPFGTGPQAAVIHRIVDREPDLERVPEELRALLAGLLAKDPRERPTARDVVRSLGGTPEAVRWVPGGTIERLVTDGEHETGQLDGHSTGPFPEGEAPSPERAPSDGDGQATGQPSGDAPAARPGPGERKGRRARVTVPGMGRASAAVAALALTISLTADGLLEEVAVGHSNYVFHVLEPVETVPVDTDFDADVARGISPSGENFVWAPEGGELEPVHLVPLPPEYRVYPAGSEGETTAPRSVAVGDLNWAWGVVDGDGSSVSKVATESQYDRDTVNNRDGYTALASDRGGHHLVAGTGDGSFGFKYGDDRLVHTHRNPDGTRALPSAVEAVAVDRETEYVASAAVVGADLNIRVAPLTDPDPEAGHDLYLGPEEIYQAEDESTVGPWPPGEDSSASDGVAAMALGPGGETVVFAVGEAVIRWNTAEETAEPLVRGTGDGAVDSVAISPDGTLAAASGPKSFINVWHVPSGQRVGNMEIPQGPAPVAFTGDGAALRTVDAKNVFTEWDVSVLG